MATLMPYLVLAGVFTVILGLYGIVEFFRKRTLRRERHVEKVPDWDRPPRDDSVVRTAPRDVGIAWEDDVNMVLDRWLPYGIFADRGEHIRDLKHRIMYDLFGRD